MCSLWWQQPSEKHKRYDCNFPCFPERKQITPCLDSSCRKNVFTKMSPSVEYMVRLQNELLGSCPWKQKLKPEAIPTIFAHKPARCVHVVTFGFLYTSGVSCHFVCIATSNLLSLSLLLLLEVRADRAGLWGKFMGIPSGLSFCLQGHDPSSSFWSLIVYSKQSASKCSKHNRLNARQSENFTEFLLKASSKLFKSIKCFLSNVKRS